MEQYTVLLCLLLVNCKGLNGICGPYWTVVGNNYCYRVGDAKLTWRDANTQCHMMDSTLVRLYDANVINDVQTVLKSSTDTRWWTGLNDLSNPQDWTFDIGQYAVYPPDPTAFQWIQEPDDTRHLQNCAALNIQGSVSDERCSDHYRYICEYANINGGNCLPGWFNFSTSSCYLFPSGLRDPWSTLTWDAANQKCQTILNGTAAAGMNSHLLFLETKDEQNYMAQQLPLISMTSEIWWIGLTDAQTEGQFKWMDGSPVGNIVFWAQEPNNLGAQERCVYTNSNGSMADFNCNNYVNYICMKESDVNNEVLPGLGCPSSWTRAGQYCYLMEGTTKRTWSDAQAMCQQSGANLIKVDSIDKKIWLESQNSVFESGLWFWTSLINNKQSHSKWNWAADGSSANMDLIKWTTEPNSYKGLENCAVVLKSGTFNDVDCHHTAGYICEFNAEDSACFQGWVSLNEGDYTDCFYFGDELVTYYEAHAKCNAASYPMESFLAAVDNKVEMAFIIKQIQSRTSGPGQYYTGLVDIGHFGIWTFDTSWNPQPDSSLIPWTKYPIFKTGSENCVVIIFGAQYINTECADKHAYICERPAYGVEVNAGTRVFNKRFSVSSVFVLIMYFIVYGICLHYILHLTYVLFPAYA